MNEPTAATPTSKAPVTPTAAPGAKKPDISHLKVGAAQLLLRQVSLDMLAVRLAVEQGTVCPDCIAPFLDHIVNDIYAIQDCGDDTDLTT